MVNWVRRWVYVRCRRDPCYTLTCFRIVAQRSLERRCKRVKVSLEYWWIVNWLKCVSLSVDRPGGIPARSEKGERLLLFIGIIDILQSYRLKKKLEHTFKSIIHDGVSFSLFFSSSFIYSDVGNTRKINRFYLDFIWRNGGNVTFSFVSWINFQDTVSVCRPSFYAQRFQDFMAKTVFKKIPSRMYQVYVVIELFIFWIKSFAFPNGIYSCFLIFGVLLAHSKIIYWY